jgi:hypothetical protein
LEHTKTKGRALHVPTIATEYANIAIQNDRMTHATKNAKYIVLVIRLIFEFAFLNAIVPPANKITAYSNMIASTMPNNPHPVSHKL